MYLMEIVIDLVSPYISELWNTLWLLLAIHAPISEHIVKEIVAKNVADDMLVEITERAFSTSLFCICSHHHHVQKIRNMTLIIYC